MQKGLPVLSLPITTNPADAINVQTVPNADFDANAAQQHVKHHHHHKNKKANQFWTTVFTVAKIVAIGAVATFAAPLLVGAVPIFGSMGVAGTALAAGASCAATDAAFQVVGVQLHTQEHFSVNEVIETAMGSGIGAGAAAAGFGFAARAAATAASSGLAQSAEIAAGTRKEIDLKAIGMQVASSFVSSVVNELMPTVNNALDKALPNAVETVGQENVALVTNTLANSTANTALDSAVNDTPFGLDAVLINSLGTVIGNKLGNLVKNHLMGNPPFTGGVDTEASENEFKSNNSETTTSIEEDSLSFPTEIEIHAFIDDIDDTLKLVSSAMTPPAEAEHNPSVTASEKLVKLLRTNNGETSTFDKFSTTQKILLGLGAAAIVPAEVIEGGLYVAGRIVTSLAAGPVTEILAVDEMAIPALVEVAGPAAARVAGAVGAAVTAEKAVSKLSQFFVSEERSVNALANGMGKEEVTAKAFTPIENAAATTANEAAKVKSLPAPRSLDNLEARKWYHQQLEQIPERIDKNLPVREQALEAFRMRNEIKMQTRELMIDQQAVAKFPPPQTLNEAAGKSYEKNIVGDKMWDKILEGSQKTNKAVDESFGLNNDFAKRNSP